MPNISEDIPKTRLIEKILKSDMAKFQMVTLQRLNTIKIDELSRFLLNVEENQPSEKVEHAFSAKLRERGRSRGNYDNHNQNINKKSSQGNASSSRGRGRNSNQFRRRGRDGSRKRGQGRHGGRNGGIGGGPQCYYCQNFFHLERDCYAKIRDLEHKGANIVVEETRNEKLFISSLMAHREACVSEVKGKGIVSIPTLHGNKKLIEDTLLTPTLKKNLVSIGQMIEKNYKLVFDNKECLIMDKLNENEVVARGEMTEDKIFKLSFDSSNSQSFKATKKENSKLWNLRMGHLNFQSLVLLIKQNMVNDLSYNKLDDKVCEGCTL
eukprot:PITA_01602